MLGISGSLRRGSYNTALLRAASGLGPPATRLAVYADLYRVPPYSEDDDIEPSPRTVLSLRRDLVAADALLIATPEYNGSVPGQLKNALDWASRPFPANALRRKHVAVIGASTGIFGAVWAQAELRKILTTAGAVVLDNELIVPDAPAAFDDLLQLTDSTVTNTLRELVADLAAATRTTAAEADHAVVR